MTAKNLTIIFNTRIPMTFRELEYEIHDGILELHDIKGYPKYYKKLYPLNTIAHVTVNYDEDED